MLRLTTDNIEREAARVQALVYPLRWIRVGIEVEKAVKMDEYRIL